ncbi:MAG: hypothetical protein U9O94_00410 [Nanoarchaeota archaeon]|nr:hypothetical protein [Nanoarchaeota archaeon]
MKFEDFKWGVAASSLIKYIEQGKLSIDIIAEEAAERIFTISFPLCSKSGDVISQIRSVRKIFESYDPKNKKDRLKEASFCTDYNIINGYPEKKMIH